MMFKHNFSPHNVPLRNNRVILSRRKSISMEDWMEKQIWSITHLLDNNGNILDLNEFNTKYNINCSIEVYTKVTQNIPRILIQSILKNKKTEFLVNNLIIVTKYYVHECPPSHGLHLKMTNVS